MLSVAQGLTAKEIAREFGIAPGTVVKRLACAIFKLGVHRQGAMVAEAMRRQIITPLCLLLAGLMAILACTGAKWPTATAAPQNGTQQHQTKEHHHVDTDSTSRRNNPHQ